VDSTNTLSKIGFIRVKSLYSSEYNDYPLYETQLTANRISIQACQPLYENYQYKAELLLSKKLDTAVSEVAVNGSDPYLVKLSDWKTARINSSVFYCYDIDFSSNDNRPFMLTFGFVRIEVSITSNEETSHYFTTKDIPCLSKDDYDSSLIAEIIDELFDSKNDTVFKWMLNNKTDSFNKYSILDSSLSHKTPKSLQSIIQLLEEILYEYEFRYSYFQSNGYCRIKTAYSKLPFRKIQHAGNEELRWIGKNPDILIEVSDKSSISYLGRFYLPHHIETKKKIKSFDNYENRLIIGFLNELINYSKNTLRYLKDNSDYIADIEKQLLAYNKKHYFFPALTLIREYSIRESRYIERLNHIISRLNRAYQSYKAIFPDVNPVFKPPLQKTKVFQEIAAYSAIYSLIIKWQKFGEFDLARENLALHALKLDKLYEYYVLLKLLSWFQENDFVPDNSLNQPIISAEYSLKDRFFKNEKRVATIYHLKNKDTRVCLYYQPVIYGSTKEEYGIKLHRLSPRNPNSKKIRDSYWTPDYLIEVTKKDCEPNYFIFDAKYAYSSFLWKGFPKTGVFSECLLKYKLDISGKNPSEKIKSVWLLCGRDKEYLYKTAEFSTWARNNNIPKEQSGIASLNPKSNSLNEIFKDLIRKYNDSNYSRHHLSTSREVANSKPRSKTIENDLRELIKKLYTTINNKENLFNAKWAESNIGLSHPLLRYRLPQGKEGKSYISLTIEGSEYFAYSNLLPSNKNRIRSFIKKYENQLSDTFITT